MTLRPQPSRGNRLWLRVYWSRETLASAEWGLDRAVRVTIRYDPDTHSGEIVEAKDGWRIVRVRSGGAQLQIPYHGRVPAELGAVHIRDYLSGPGWIRFPWPWPRHATPDMRGGER